MTTTLVSMYETVFGTGCVKSSEIMKDELTTYYRNCAVYKQKLVFEKALADYEDAQRQNVHHQKRLHQLRRDRDIVDKVLMVRIEKDIEDLETRMEMKLKSIIDDTMLYSFDELLQHLKDEDAEYVSLKSQKSKLYETLDFLENHYEKIDDEIYKIQQQIDAIKPNPPKPPRLIIPELYIIDEMYKHHNAHTRDVVQCQQ